MARLDGYIETDLTVRSTKPLSDLITYLDGKVVCHLSTVKFRGGQQALFNTYRNKGTPEKAIATMLDAFEALDKEGLRLLAECKAIEFSIGMNGPITDFAFAHKLSASLLPRIAALGASLEFVVYSEGRSPLDAEASSGHS